MSECCAIEGNTCGFSLCFDYTASDDFLYRLSPGAAERYEPRSDTTVYQTADPNRWPAFGSDLNFAIDRRIPSYTCSNQGSSYRGAPNEVCGGRAFTDLEVWRPVP